MTTTPAAPVLDYHRSDAPGTAAGPGACLYVQVDATSRPDVAAFLAGWRGCCDRADLDWRTVRRPMSALVSVELSHSCGAEASLRLVFDARRDQSALDTLADTGRVVVGSRRLGRFANRTVAYRVSTDDLRDAWALAERGLDQLVAS